MTEPEVLLGIGNILRAQRFACRILPIVGRLITRSPETHHEMA